MSATNRGTKRRKNDVYTTPAHVVRSLFESVQLPGGRYLECCAGDGAIIRAVNALRQDIEWSYCELRPECATPLERMCRRGDLGGKRPCGVIGDYMTAPLQGPFDLVITNPPFALAEQVITRSMKLAPRGLIVMLLRLNYLESERRSAFLREHAPDTYVLCNRPSFVRNKKGKRATDATGYAWYIWHGDKRRTHGRMQVLPPVPKAVRIADEERNYEQPRRTAA